MSNYVYLECLDHDPVLRAPSESGQHLYDLPQIQKDFADRDVLVRLHNEADGWGLNLGHFRNATVAFMVDHPHCRLGVRDEYGEEHPIATPSPTADTEEP